MKANSFDILKTMGERNLDIRGFSIADNLKRVQSGKQWGEVVIAVNNQTAQELMIGDKKLLGMLIVADREQFDQIKKELESEDPQ